ncbi:CN hydrolase domain containing protein [Asbolus verrucosus]|uniref:CN hydrolase domain containing protein n=1 Tax=Asbolus verrucosus TaxID=1661398 RepID=A0A482W9E1_ASBVE|nr:CN hydrolase domain containing protein [Asbolus verrucosus]
MLFKSPAQDLLSKNVDAIIYPSMWYSELPFLTSLQTQQMWSYAHDIPLLAAGANNPSLGSGGTGIYKGAEDAIFTEIVASGGLMVGVYSQVMLRKRVPNPEIDDLGKKMDEFHINIDPHVKEFNSIVLDTSKGGFYGQLCYNNNEENQICCDFAIKTTTTSSDVKKNSYTYYLVAYSGVRSFNGIYNGGVEVCGIIACLNTSLSSCGQRFPNYDDIEWPLKFEQVTIKASFEKNENKTQYPNSVLSSIRPIPASQTVWEKREVEADGKKLVERTFSLTASLWDDLTVAVVDYSPILDSRLSDEERIVINANQHVQYIGVESVKNVDLIVFPESTLTVNKTTAVELIPTDNPCFNDSSYPFYPIFVRDLSCAARAASSYVVVNLVQKVRCRIFDHGENCKTHGYLFYNTDVVFGRYGEIDSLYHKYSLFGETELDRPQPCDDVIVFVENTNFGIFTGFDIFFKNPTRCLSRYSLDGIIFPSVWFSELPFLTGRYFDWFFFELTLLAALQTQQMWSHAHNITLLAAGAKNPSLGSGGSGIYRGVEDPISLEISAEAGSTILPSDEKERDTDELAEEMDGFHLGIDPDIAGILHNSFDFIQLIDFLSQHIIQPFWTLGKIFLTRECATTDCVVILPPT